MADDPPVAFDFVTTYRDHVARLSAASDDPEEALQLAVGGEFPAFGTMMLELLKWQGLEPDHTVVDVGCGSGRLTAPLATFLTRGRYLGTDVVPELLSHASELAARPDWQFELSLDLTIPAAEASADFACFFSIFTHLRHEESFRYLQEAQRALRPGGKVVMSFLEFCVDSHWDVFESNLADIGKGAHLNQFMSRDGIEAWVRHLDMDIAGLYAGDAPHIPLSRPITLASGEVVQGLATLGQSLAILVRR